VPFKITACEELSPMLGQTGNTNFLDLSNYARICQVTMDAHGSHAREVDGQGVCPLFDQLTAHHC